MPKDHVRIYQDYEARQQRAELFRVVAEHLGTQRALYAGSWIHVAPSLFVPEVVYVDADRRCPAFFADPAVAQFIERHATYSAPPVFRFHHRDYEEPLPEPDGFFDLLISQFASIISQPCARYLEVGGHLLANDSHGDAGVAHLDPRYALAAVVDKQGAKPVLSDQDLSTYFVPKRSGDPTTIDERRAHGKGLKYTRTADHYLFRKVAEL